MAAYTSNPPFSNPHSSDFPPNPPSDQVMFSMDNNMAQRSGPPVPQIPIRPKNFARASGDYRERGDKNGNGNGTAGLSSGKPFPTQVPGQNAYNHHGPRDFVGGAAMFGGSKSPPAKNTSHVPCKFFKIGQCQAGKACPFSHATDASKAETVCKYFAKGNCKFGHRCALLHVLPNGKIANRPHGYVPSNPDILGRISHQDYLHPDALLSNGTMSRRSNGDPTTYGMQYSARNDGDSSFVSHGPIPIYNNPPPLDSTYSPYNYGSPRDDSHVSMSPVGHLSTIDAPLPASFDSQGISYMARHGPVAASMPSRFALDSPPSSLPRAAALPNDALRNLHSSAFGRENGFSKSSQRGTSPSAPLDENKIGQRMMHSQRISRPKMFSASLPRPALSDDWEDNVMFGEPGEPTLMVPDVLSDLMTSQEKERRLSGSVSGNVAPGEGSSKVGSPSGSRFGAFFQKQQKTQDGSVGMSTSPFGHVGSPLRNSTLHFGMSPSSGYRSTSQTLPIGNTLSSPPRQSSMSMISQQLQRTRISNKTDSNENLSSLHPASARSVTAPITIVRSDRNSSTSRNRIEEEQGDCMFSLDEEEFPMTKKPSSGIWNTQSEKRSSPKPGTVGEGRIARSRQLEEAAGRVGI